MNNKVFDFKKQLKTGDIGEKLFLTYYKNKNAKKTDGKVFDFTTDLGTVELKTDTYSMLETPNFFMEKYGNIKTQALGGPWRAFKDGVDFFVYFFLSNKVFFWFKSSELCSFLDVQTQNIPQRIIRNNGWETVGYLINRDSCKHLYTIDRF